jgi:hypothetical protein
MDYRKARVIDGEVWKDIAGYEGVYQVSNYGRIKTLQHLAGKRKHWVAGRIATIFIHHGCPCVNLYRENAIQRVEVHSMVAKAFVPKPSDGRYYIIHLDENKLNNHYRNLSYISATERAKNSYRKKPEIRRERMSYKNPKARAIEQYTMDGVYLMTWDSVMDIKRSLGFSHSSIVNCCCGRRKQAHKYIWKHADTDK